MPSNPSGSGHDIDHDTLHFFVCKTLTEKNKGKHGDVCDIAAGRSPKSCASLLVVGKTIDISSADTPAIKIGVDARGGRAFVG